MKLLGLTDEERLAIEQATGMKTEGVSAILEKASQQTQELAQQIVNSSIKEIQSVIGPHGAVTRLQAGGVNITPGGGVSVYESGVLKTTIEPDGDLLVGSDITLPAKTSLCVFVNDQIYNNEAMQEGDILIGDNSTGVSNVKYDVSEGQLQFRSGTTIQVYMDTDGTIKAAGGEIFIGLAGIVIANSTESALIFKDAAGNVGPIRISADVTNTLEFINLAESPAGSVAVFLKIGGSTKRVLYLGGDFFRFNEGNNDIDMMFEGTTNDYVLVIDAGNNRAEFRNSSNQTQHFIGATAVHFNEPGNDIDIIFEGDTDPTLTQWDAGLDAIGMGGAAESGYKLKVTGNLKVTGTLTSDAGIIPSADGWTLSTATWTPRSQAYTNDPAAGSNIVLNMAATGGFAVGDVVTVSSSAGSENATITVVTANTSITVNALGLNHTTTSPLVKLATTNKTFVIDTSVDLSSILELGWRLKIVESGVTKYFIIVAISTTRITIYGGLDNSLSQTAAVTSVHYSAHKMPKGFNTTPVKWTELLEDATAPSQATPAAGTWYNLGSLSLSVPIGLWRVFYSADVTLNITAAAVGAAAVQAALSTSNNSVSDNNLWSRFSIVHPITTALAFDNTLTRETTLKLAAKTTYYLIERTGSAAGNSLSLNGTQVTTQIYAICAYL